MNFEALVQAIAHVHQQLQDRAAKAVNISLTARNWLIGWHIMEFEQRGEDRAAYGQRLIEGLSERLQELTIPSCEARRLYLYRDFYSAYPHIRETLSPVLHSTLPSVSPGVTEQVEILRTLSAESMEQAQHQEIQRFGIVRAPSAQLGAPPHLLVDRLSYSHFELLTAITDLLKRAFYEIECIKGGWSVRELKRQIASLYFERSGLSLDKEALSRLANGKIETQASALTFRDPYVFNFAGLRSAEVLPESGLEAVLLDHLREFLLELGHGFCFELFVSKYQLELPKSEDLQRYLDAQRRQIEGNQAAIRNDSGTDLDSSAHKITA